MENPRERARELHKEPPPLSPPFDLNETEFERMHYGNQERERKKEK